MRKLTTLFAITVVAIGMSLTSCSNDDDYVRPDYPAIEKPIYTPVQNPIFIDVENPIFIEIENPIYIKPDNPIFIDIENPIYPVPENPVEPDFNYSTVIEVYACGNVILFDNGNFVSVRSEFVGKIEVGSYVHRDKVTRAAVFAKEVNYQDFESLSNDDYCGYEYGVVYETNVGRGYYGLIETPYYENMNTLFLEGFTDSVLN
ncbi:MAG: hypothetical protein MI866_19000 [Bacteroidales bacterium]|nr:hypothetical protein [Bacteroidales bacterium]